MIFVVYILILKVYTFRGVDVLINEMMSLYLRDDSYTLVTSGEFIWSDVKIFNSKDFLILKQDFIQTYYLYNRRLLYLSKGTYIEIRERCISEK